MDEPNDHAIALSMAQAVEADAELIATLIREEEQARRDFELARQLEQNPDAIPEAGDGADHSGLDDETYRTLQAFNVAEQQGESTGVEAELSHEETHEASSVAGGDGTGVESATGDDSQSDADNQSYDTAPRDDVSQRDEGEIQGEEIQPEETQEEGDADDQPETTQVASPAPSELYVETKECLYCSDEFPIDMIFEAPCSHAMCQPCLIRSIRTAIKDESLFPPKCCGQAIPVDTTNTFIPEELLTECDNKREEYETTNRTYCSDKACSEFIPLRTIEAGIARCTRCETRTCLNCLSEAHEGTCTDDPESQRVIRLAEKHGWRRCEQCKNMVELTHGCFHICNLSMRPPVLLPMRETMEDL
uniref:IBR domain-containing protein n=1 Tax=Fusarium oxysporum (strain Fo5176) TaxID=660025 RepID=A0A0D2YBR8_FUSOF